MAIWVWRLPCCRRWRIGLLLVLALAGQYFYTFNYPIWDFYVFYIPSYV